MAEESNITIEELWEFLNMSSGLFCILGKNGHFRHVNPALTQLLGYESSDLLSKPAVNFIHPEDQKASTQMYKKLKRSKIMCSFNNRYRTAGGQYRWLSWTAIVPNSRGTIYCIAQDLTEKMALENQIIEERLEKEKSLIQATSKGKELQRIEIGRELHDNINQMLGTVKLYMDIALSDDLHQREMIGKGKILLGEIIEEIRILSRAMSGAEAKNIELRDSIKELIETTLTIRNISTRFECCPQIQNISSRLKLSLFRIIQEQINNIIKHADAENVFISIYSDGKDVDLEIRDDGVGFNELIQKNGIGLSNIKARVSLFNGCLTIKSSPGEGCILRMRIPGSMMIKVA